MDGAENCACALELNPDITGIGVRVALYVQILLGWCTSLVWRNTFFKNARTAYMIALALIIAAFIELTTQTLSLLDGLVVSFITTMMIVFAIASYSRADTKNPDEGENKSGDEEEEDDGSKSISRRLMQGCFVVFWGAWCFNMWRDPAHFGLKDEAANCDTNYNITIQLFTEVHATDPGVRSAALALVGIGFVIALLSLFITLERLAAPFEWLIAKFKGEKAEETNQRSGVLATYEDKPTLYGLHLFLQLLTVGIFIFLIYVIERTIQKNDVDNSTRDWSYGQTIALILLLQQIMDLFSTYIEEQEKKERRQEREAFKNGDVPGGPFTFEMTKSGGQTPSPNADEANVQITMPTPNVPPAP